MDRTREQLLAARLRAPGRRPVCAVAGLGVALLAGCLHPADERARRDFEEVGRASVAGVEVTIDPGAVTDVTEGSSIRLVMRASAPVAMISLDGADPGASFEIRIENVTADAVVTGTGLDAVAAPSPLIRTVTATAPAVIRVAPEDAGVPRRIRFGYVSDLHVRTDNVAAMAEAIVDDPTIELVLSGGDLVDSGADRGQWDAMMQALAALPVPFYSTIGNHEVNWDDGAEYHRRLGRASYAFDHHGVRFVLVDGANATLAPRVFRFADEALADGGADVRVFVTHVPLLDSSGLRNAGFSSRLEAEKILAMLVRNQVDLTLYGHVHALETFENAGIPAYIGGGGGGHDNVFDDVDHYFLVFTVDPAAREIEAEIVDLK